MPLPFPGITLHSDVLAVFAVFGARWRSRLRHCATGGFDSRFFIHNPTGRTLTLGSIQSFNRNEYLGGGGGIGKGGRCLGLTTLPPSCADCLETVGVNILEPKDLSRPVRGLLKNVCDVER
jgi:hypothetical protein